MCLQDEMRARGGGYERLRRLRAAEQLSAYSNKLAFCMLGVVSDDLKNSFDWRTGELTIP